MPCISQVKLENHYLHIHDDKECEDAVVVKIRLSNCVVLDCTGEARPWVLEIRRTIGQALFLQADSEAGENAGCFLAQACIIVVRFPFYVMSVGPC